MAFMLKMLFEKLLAQGGCLTVLFIFSMSFVKPLAIKDYTKITHQRVITNHFHQRETHTHHMKHPTERHHASPFRPHGKQRYS